MSHGPGIDKILNVLEERGIIASNNLHVRHLKGTTDGLVYILSNGEKPQYVLKLDHAEQIKLAEQFLTAYSGSELLSRVFYVDPDKAYMVYAYIEGMTHYNRGLKINWMTRLVEDLLNHYKQERQSETWGRLELPRQSWREFNEGSLEYARETVADLLPCEDHYKIKRLVENKLKDEGPEAKYLLHGDTGVHNFVYAQNKLVGVIDPSPMLGPVLYDFTYAFCSSPDDLNLETLHAAYALLTHEQVESSRLIEETVFQLYCRIGICTKHHPHDLEEYLKVWSYWKTLIE
ncbi:phosphotransferase [Paenibacillus sp. sgz302251]|uniref:phosphotransferase n=1 Tax=Paenibacillus sp. sgz302251 TaxID=3414493 RepID=UPI003C7AFA3D